MLDKHLSNSIRHLFFSVEATSVTVGYVDVTVRLEDCQLQTPQDSIKQLTAGSLRKEQREV